MSRFPLAVIGALVIGWSGSGEPVSSAPSTPVLDPLGYEDLYAQVVALAPNAERVAPVDHLTLRRDAGTFELTSGQLVLLTPVNGREVAAVFVGEGAFRLAPPNPVEQAEVRRMLEMEPLMQPFTSVFVMFTDSTLAELQQTLTFAPGVVPDDADDVVKEALDRLTDDDHKWMNRHLAEALLNGAAGQFYAHLYERKHDFLIFHLDPFAREEVAVYKRAEGRDRGDELDTVCSFRWAAAGGAPHPPVEDKDRVKIGHYTVESWIQRNISYAGAATMEITPVMSDLRWVPFAIYPELEVDSARWEDGSAATYFQGHEAGTVWLAMQPFAASETRSVTVYYHGWPMERDGDWMYIKSTETWYPRHDGDLSATFDLTFHTPDIFDLVAVGDLVDSSEADHERTTRWVTTEPVNHPGFNIGKFEEYSQHFQGIPDFTVQLSRSAHEQLNTRYLTGVNMIEDVARDVGSSLAFFTEMFGPLPYERLYATEIPFLHGQAFPGLIHLSYATFLKDLEDEAEIQEAFRAHEIAHQWWGLVVPWKTYRDQWLSEGFAEFSALWYLDLGLNEHDKALDILKDYRERIFDDQEKLGPIDIGRRNALEGDYSNYDLIVYRKGAWVLQMLRLLLQDLQTGSDATFQSVMHQFYTDFAGRPATTQDFVETAERTTGRDLGWFFDQWVYGTALPTYRFASQTEPTADGQYVIRLRVKQEDVPETFKMTVPVMIEFTDGQVGYVPMEVTGPVSELELPPIGLEPKQLKLNPDEAVLAKVENESW